MIERTNNRRELEGAAREADDATASLIRMVVPTKSSPNWLQRTITEVDEALRELRTRVAAPLERGLPKPKRVDETGEARIPVEQIVQTVVDRGIDQLAVEAPQPIGASIVVAARSRIDEQELQGVIISWQKAYDAGRILESYSDRENPTTISEVRARIEELGTIVESIGSGSETSGEVTAFEGRFVSSLTSIRAMIDEARQEKDVDKAQEKLRIAEERTKAMILVIEYSASTIRNGVPSEYSVNGLDAMETFGRLIDAAILAVSEIGGEKDGRARVIIESFMMVARNFDSYVFDDPTIAIKGKLEEVTLFTINSAELLRNERRYTTRQKNADQTTLTGFESDFYNIRQEVRKKEEEVLGSYQGMRQIEDLLDPDAHGILHDYRIWRSNVEGIASRMYEDANVFGDLTALPSYEEMTAVITGHASITGELETFSQRKRQDSLRECANILRGDLPEEAVKEGTPAWFGLRALSALEAGNEELADLCNHLGRITLIAQGRQEEYVRSYDQIIRIINGNEIPVPGAIEELINNVKIGTIRAEADEIIRRYNTGRGEDRNRIRTSAERVVEIISDDSLDGETRLSNAGRLLDMTISYIGMLEGHGWRTFEGLEGMRAAIDRELGGTDSQSQFNASLGRTMLRDHVDGLEQEIGVLERYGLTTQSNFARGILNHGEMLIEQGRINDAAGVFELLGEYVSIVGAFAVQKPGEQISLEQRELQSVQGMESALMAICGSAAWSQTKGTYISSLEQATQLYLEEELTRLRQLVALRPIGREVITNALNVAEGRLAIGDVEGASTLLGMIGGFYGNKVQADPAQEGTGKDEGWIYDAFARGSLHNNPVIVAGREKLLDAIRLETIAGTSFAHREAVRKFGEGSERVSTCYVLSTEYQHIAESYNAKEMEALRIVDSRTEGKKLSELLKDLYNAAATGDTARYNLAVEGYNARMRGVAKIARDQAIQGMVDSLTQLGTGSLGIYGYYDEVPAGIDRVNGYQWQNGHVVRSENVTSPAQYDYSGVSYDQVGASYVNTGGERTVKKPAETISRLSEVDIPEETAKRLAALEERRQRLLADIETARQNNGDLGALFDEYDSLAKAYDREQRLGLAYATVTTEIRTNERYRMRVGSTSDTLDGVTHGPTDSALRLIGESTEKLEKAKQEIIAGNMRGVVQTYENGIRLRMDACEVYSTANDRYIDQDLSGGEGVGGLRALAAVAGVTTFEDRVNAERTRIREEQKEIDRRFVEIRSEVLREVMFGSNEGREERLKRNGRQVMAVEVAESAIFETSVRTLSNEIANTDYAIEIGKACRDALEAATAYANGDYANGVILYTSAKANVERLQGKAESVNFWIGTVGVGTFLLAVTLVQPEIGTFGMLLQSADNAYTEKVLTGEVSGKTWAMMAMMAGTAGFGRSAMLFRTATAARVFGKTEAFLLSTGSVIGAAGLGGIMTIDAIGQTVIAAESGNTKEAVFMGMMAIFPFVHMAGVRAFEGPGTRRTTGPPGQDGNGPRVEPPRGPSTVTEPPRIVTEPTRVVGELDLNAAPKPPGVEGMERLTRHEAGDGPVVGIQEPSLQSAPEPIVQAGDIQPLETRETPTQPTTTQPRRLRFSEDQIVEIFAEILPSEEATADMYKAATQLRDEPPEVVARIRERVMEQIEREHGRGMVRRCGRDYDVLHRFTDYRSAYELGNIMYGELTARNSYHQTNGPTYHSLYTQAMERGSREPMEAHGIEVGKGGLGNLVSIMIDGEISRGETGPLIANDSGWSAGGHGPFYILVEDGAGRVVYEPSIRMTFPESSHIAYLLPEAADVVLVRRALDVAVERGLITLEQSNSYSARLITYEEFIAAPDGTFENVETFRTWRNQPEPSGPTRGRAPVTGEEGQRGTAPPPVSENQTPPRSSRLWTDEPVVDENVLTGSPERIGEISRRRSRQTEPDQNIERQPEPVEREATPREPGTRDTEPTSERQEVTSTEPVEEDIIDLTYMFEPVEEPVQVPEQQPWTRGPELRRQLQQRLQQEGDRTNGTFRYEQDTGEERLAYSEEHVTRATEIVEGTERLLDQNPDFARADSEGKMRMALDATAQTLEGELTFALNEERQLAANPNREQIERAIAEREKQVDEMYAEADELRRTRPKTDLMFGELTPDDPQTQRAEQIEKCAQQINLGTERLRRVLDPQYMQREGLPPPYEALVPLDASPAERLAIAEDVVMASQRREIEADLYANLRMTRMMEEERDGIRYYTLDKDGYFAPGQRGADNLPIQWYTKGEIGAGTRMVVGAERLLREIPDGGYSSRTNEVNALLSDYRPEEISRIVELASDQEYIANRGNRIEQMRMGIEIALDAQTAEARRLMIGAEILWQELPNRSGGDYGNRMGDVNRILGSRGYWPDECVRIADLASDSDYIVAASTNRTEQRQIAYDFAEELMGEPIVRESETRAVAVGEERQPGFARGAVTPPKERAWAEVDGPLREVTERTEPVPDPSEVIAMRRPEELAGEEIALRELVSVEEEMAVDLRSRFEEFTIEMTEYEATGGRSGRPIEALAAEHPEYAARLQRIIEAEPVDRLRVAKQQAELTELGEMVPESSETARRLHLIVRDISAQARGEPESGFIRNINEGAVAGLLSRDGAYAEAIAKGNIEEALAIAGRYEELLNVVETTTPTIQRGQYVDVVANANGVIPIGDTHAGYHGLLMRLERANVIEVVSIREGTYRFRELSRGRQIVFEGDLIDRGAYSMETLDLIRNLREHARTQGAEVHVIKGNHEVLFERFIELHGSQTASEVRAIFGDQQVTRAEGVDWRRVGTDKTFESMINRYKDDPRRMRGEDEWQAAQRLFREDGYMDFISSTRGAVIIDGEMYTHAGPVLSVNNITELDAHFANLFSSTNNHWTHTELGSGLGWVRRMTGRLRGENQNWRVYFDAVRNGDYSSAYVGREALPGEIGRWENDPRLGPWMQQMGIRGITVGHANGEAVQAYGPYVTCVDTGINRGRGELLIIDPLAEVPSRILGSSTPEGVAPDQPYRPGLTRTQLMPGNRIAEAAERTYTPPAP